MILNQDFKEFVQLLNDSGVKYLIVGGYAVAFHGHPRYTKDLDIWLWVNPENAERILVALERFGFGALDLSTSDFLELGTVVQLGYPPNRIDLLMGVDGVEFESCYETKVQETIEGVEFHFIDLENLKKNKKASGRFQDLADLENLH